MPRWDTTRNLQFEISASHIRRWLWPALFMVLVVGVFVIGLLVSDRGVLNRWFAPGASTSTTATAAGQVPSNNAMLDRAGLNTGAAVVAVVNGQVISQAELDRAIAVGRTLYRAANGHPPEKVDEAGIIRQLVGNALVMQAAEANGITVTDPEITAAIQQVKVNQGISDPALATAIQAEGITTGDIQAEIRQVVIDSKFRQQVFAGQAETAYADWLKRQRAQADIQMQQIAAAEPVVSRGDPVAGALAPDFTLQDQAGKDVTLSDSFGQPLLLYFWTTWCPPCQAELPAIEAAFQKYKGQGFQVLAVNVQEQPALIQNFTQEFGLTFPALLDETGAVAKRYRVRGLPTSFFVNPQGAITAVQVGAMSPRALEQFTTGAIANTQIPQQMRAGGQDDEHTDNEVHWHTRLRIIVDGREEKLFNLENQEFIDIHHPNLTLGQALEKYKIDYAEDCILESCQEPERSGKLTVRINGEEVADFADYLLHDGDEVVMELQ